MERHDRAIPLSMEEIRLKKHRQTIQAFAEKHQYCYCSMCHVNIMSKNWLIHCKGLKHKYLAVLSHIDCEPCELDRQNKNEPIKNNEI